MAPSFDHKSGWLCQDRLVIGGWIAAELERVQIEAQRRIAELLKSKITIAPSADTASVSY
jgi:hypothetical protein